MAECGAMRLCSEMICSGGPDFQTEWQQAMIACWPGITSGSKHVRSWDRDRTAPYQPFEAHFLAVL